MMAGIDPRYYKQMSKEWVFRQEFDSLLAISLRIALDSLRKCQDKKKCFLSDTFCSECIRKYTIFSIEHGVAAKLNIVKFFRRSEKIIISPNGANTKNFLQSVGDGSFPMAAVLADSTTSSEYQKKLFLDEVLIVFG